MSQLQATVSVGTSLPADPLLGRSVTDVSRQQVSVVDIPAQVLRITPEGQAEGVLEQLYPDSRMNAFLKEQLRPQPMDPALLTPAGIRTMLDTSARSVKSVAIRLPSEARRLGRLGRLLDDQEGLCRLANLYVSALLRG